MTQNNPKLIRLDHALQAISEQYRSDMPEHDLNLLIAARKRLKQIPTVDTAEVVHGQWLSKWHGNTNNGTCSVCGSYDHAYAFGWKYCPDCGAKMDLK